MDISMGKTPGFKCVNILGTVLCTIT